MDIDTSINGTGAASYYLADGTYFAIQIQSDGYAQVIVDANGHKKPNIFGYDIHSYALYTGLGNAEADFYGQVMAVLIPILLAQKIKQELIVFG